MEKGSAVRLVEQKTLSYGDVKLLRKFIWDYGHSTVISCLQTIACNAIENGQASDLMYADQAAFLARQLKDENYRKAYDLESRLLGEMALLNKEIDASSAELREIHAEFSLFWMQIKKLVKPYYPFESRTYQIERALEVDWGLREKLDIELLQAVISAFFDEILRRAAILPGDHSWTCSWDLSLGTYLKFSELAERVPEFAVKGKRAVKLLKSKQQSMVEVDKLDWNRADVTRKCSDYLTSLLKTLHVVGIDKLAEHLDKNTSGKLPA